MRDQPGQHPKEQACERRIAILSLLGDRPRDMALEHVTHLMAEHRSELGLGLRHLDQPRIDADKSAGQ